MWPFDGWKRVKAERKLVDDMRISEGIENATRQVVNKLENAKKFMASKHCPIHGTPCQLEACVHFYKGMASVKHNSEFHGLPEFWKNYSPPKCKLWHE